MNKNILIITPFFPPQTHAAVFRAFKLVKYLKRTGWNPIVLTVNRNYLYLEDPDLLDWFMEVGEPPREELKAFILKLKKYVHG